MTADDNHHIRCARDHAELEKIKSDIHNIQMNIVKIEVKLSHTLENKHAEALSTAKAIDTKFRWVSVLVGGVAAIGVLMSLLK